MNSRKKKTIIGLLLGIFGSPIVLLLIAWASLHFLNRTNGTIVSSGQERQYLLYVPKSYDSAKPTPLIISMHGAAMWPAQQAHLSRWNRLADQHGFIVVYPSGTTIRGSGTGVLPKFWHVDAGGGLSRDVRFISELIERLEASYNIDATRIYANGMSNGGGMAFVVSCALSDRIAAVGMVAAAQTLPSSWCTNHQPVPMIEFHGTADPIVPYDGGPSGDPFNPVEFPSVRDWAAQWARRNQCDAQPRESRITANVSRTDYLNCNNSADVVLYSVHGAGHSWPGGKPLPEWLVGQTNREIDATLLMWQFFQEHKLQSTCTTVPRS